MTIRERLEASIAKAESEGLNQLEAYRSACAVSKIVTADSSKLHEALRKLDEACQQHTLDGLTTWFDNEKVRLTQDVIDSPIIFKVFDKANSLRERLAERPAELITYLGPLRALLEAAVVSWHQIRDALARAEEALAGLDNHPRGPNSFLRSRLQRLQGRFIHGYEVELAEVEEVCRAATARLAELRQADEDRRRTQAHVDEFLTGQIERFEEKMTLKEYKRLEPLKESIDDPNNRRALWHLVREHENMHATPFEFAELNVVKKRKGLSAKGVETGWKSLTLLRQNLTDGERAEVLTNLREALGKSGKKAEQLLDLTHDLARAMVDE